MDWYQIKLAVTEATGISRDALHVFGGVAVHLIAALLLRSTLARPAPWVIVWTAAIANEWFDLHYEIWPNRLDQWAESVVDVAVTVLIPTVLLLLARQAPWLLVGNRKKQRRRS